MKQKCTLLIIIISAGLFNACKKKSLPEPEEGNNPQFYFKGTVNGSYVNLEAGVNDYYMYSSYMQNTSNNCYSFSGHIKQEACNSCINSIKIEINDHKNSNVNGPSGANVALVPAFYPYAAGAPAPSSWYYQFISVFNNSPVSWYWDFGDGDTSSAFNPTHIYTRSGEYNVSLTVTDNFSCSNTVSNIQKVGVSDSYCNTTITVTSTSSLNATFTHSTAGIPPYNFSWDFGDGNTSTQATPNYTYSNPGRYPVTLKVVDAIGDSARANMNYITSSSSLCTTNYLVAGNYGMSNPSAWSNITVKWTDSNGTEYTSDNAGQPATSYFKIVSSEDYHDNENAQKTKKLRLKFKCMVYGATGSMLIENAEATVVVAYK